MIKDFIVAVAVIVTMLAILHSYKQKNCKDNYQNRSKEYAECTCTRYEIYGNLQEAETICDKIIQY